MDLAASLLTFTMFWKLSGSLQCYRCSPEHDTPLVCSQFDYSNKFLVQCEKSTMCFKKITTLDFGDGLKSHSVTRGCAPQTTNGEQRKINGKWRAVQDIYEVYDESCSDYPGNDDRSTKTIHCYCRGDQCNGAPKILRNILTLSLMALTVFMLS